MTKGQTLTTTNSGPWSKYAQKTWVYVVALAALVIIVFSGFVFSDKMLFCSDQLSGLDSRVFFRDAVQTHHQFPFWLTPRLGGMPTIDALFGDAFYPPSMIMNVVFPVHRAIGLKMILHIFLAGLFFFLMLRRGFKISAPIAFIGAVFYLLNPEFFSHIYPGHDGKMYVIAWLPFIVWRLKALADKASFLNASLLGLGVGISLLTSHIQMTYFVLWGLFFYGVFFAVRKVLKNESGTALRFGAFFCLAVVIGLAIGFIQLYPSLMYVRDAFSVRGVDRGFEYASSWSLHWPEFFSLWVPEFGNTLDYYWGGNPFKLNSEYAGGIVLLLAVIAVVWKSRPWRWFWFGVAGFAVLYSLGAHTPVFHIAYAIVPGVKKFRACSMIMFWFSFSTILLAVLFLKDMLSGQFHAFNDREKKSRTKALLITLAAVFAVTVIFSMKDFLGGLFPFIGMLDTRKRQIFDANFSRNFVPMLWLWFVFAGGVLGLIIAVLQGKLKPGVAIGIILAIGLIDVLRVDAQFLKVIDPRPYFYQDPALDKLRHEMATAPFRVFSLPGAFQGQNAEGVQGLEGVGGFHDNELRWYREFRGDQQDRNYFNKLIGVSPSGEPYLKAEQIDKGNAFLDLANVKYLLARNGSDLLALENKNALGRVSFAPNFVVMDSVQILGALQNESYNIRTTVALLAQPAQKPAAVTPDSIAQAASAEFSGTWQRYSPNDRIVKVAAPQDGFMRISEVYYPGWKVSIDGKDAPVYRSDLAWMAVFIQKGNHLVEMKANSLYFGKAKLVTFPIVLLLLAYWSVALVIGRKKTSVKVAAAEVPAATGKVV
jgi:hypothetical protein